MWSFHYCNCKDCRLWSLMLDQHLLAARLWASMLAGSKGLQNVLPHCLRTTEIESEENKNIWMSWVLEIYWDYTCGFFLLSQPDFSFDSTTLPQKNRRDSKHLFEVLLRVVALMDSIYSSWLSSSTSSFFSSFFVSPSVFVLPSLPSPDGWTQLHVQGHESIEEQVLIYRNMLGQQHVSMSRNYNCSTSAERQCCWDVIVLLCLKLFLSAILSFKWLHLIVHLHMGLEHMLFPFF